MAVQKNVLVFPCGSEVGLEIKRSLRFDARFNLIGASSVQDHGRFAFDRYFGDIPFHDSPEFLSTLGALCRRENVDAIFPSMDAVARTLKRAESELPARVIGSPTETTSTCASKSAVYSVLEDIVPIPAWSMCLTEPLRFPMFIKPDEGYGSRDVLLAKDRRSVEQFLDARPAKAFVFSEYLPGSEYTIDCFTDRHGELRFVGPRDRVRVANGISVSTRLARRHKATFCAYADAINRSIRFRGAWFFQMKEDASGQPKLLEVAARLGGGSSFHRAMGVNFAALTLEDAYDEEVKVLVNAVEIEVDRALSSRYKFHYHFEVAYVGYDQCLFVSGRLNHVLVGVLFKLAARGVRLVLIDSFFANPKDVLRSHRLGELFDEVICIEVGDAKHRHMQSHASIFIDASLHQRKLAMERLGVPVFSLDMIEVLADG